MAEVFWPQSVKRALSGMAFKADTGPQLQQIGAMESESSMQAAGWQPMPEMAQPEAPQAPAPLPAVELPSLDEMTKKWAPQSQPVMPTGAPSSVQPAAGTGQTINTPRQNASAAASGQYGEIDNSSRQAFVRTAYPYMLEAAGGDANLAELMLAKAISENGSIGTGKPFFANNFSGIKGEGDAGSVEADTWEDYGNGRVNIRDKFAAYSTPQKGMAAFMQFLQDNPRYHGALARYRQTGNADALFDDILTAGYATDSQWASKVRNIRDNQVAPVVRGQRQSSMNAAGPTAATSPQPATGGSSPPAAGLPPSVAQKWQARTGGAQMTAEDLQQLRMLGVVA